MYRGFTARRKLDSVRPVPTTATYASIVTAGPASVESPGQDIATGEGRIADGGTAVETMPDGIAPGAGPDTPDALVVTPATPGIVAPTATPNWADEVDTGTSHRPVIKQPQQMMEVTEPRGDCAIRQHGEVCNLTMLSSGTSPVRRAEDTGATSGGEEDASADRVGTPVPRKREGTSEDLGRSPKSNKKMEIDKLGEQHHERSRSLPRRASLKSVKTRDVPMSAPTTEG
jgi:hypothetical protein